jgi:hypothetical protein
MSIRPEDVPEFFLDEICKRAWGDPFDDCTKGFKAFLRVVAAENPGVLLSAIMICNKLGSANIELERLADYYRMDRPDIEIANAIRELAAPSRINGE